MENRKLELADICMYLPYGLKVQIGDYDDYLYYVSEECGISDKEISPNSFEVSRVDMSGYLYFLDDYTDESHIETIKPILRPMSDLTKPMTHPDVNGGVEFVPIDLFIPTLGCIVEVNYINGRELQIFIKTDSSTIMNIHYLSISDFKLLAKLHFDYQNLIDQGLAIDINTTTL